MGSLGKSPSKLTRKTIEIGHSVFNPIPCANQNWIIRVKDTHCLASVNVDITISSCIHPVYIFIPIT